MKYQIHDAFVSFSQTVNPDRFTSDDILVNAGVLPCLSDEGFITSIGTYVKGRKNTRKIWKITEKGRRYLARVV